MYINAPIRIFNINIQFFFPNMSNKILTMIYIINNLLLINICKTKSSTSFFTSLFLSQLYGVNQTLVLQLHRTLYPYYFCSQALAYFMSFSVLSISYFVYLSHSFFRNVCLYPLSLLLSLVPHNTTNLNHLNLFFLIWSITGYAFTIFPN